MSSANMFDPYGGDEAAPLVEQRFFDFLRDFHLAVADEDAEIEPAAKVNEYQLAVKYMAANDMTTLFVDFLHLNSFDDALASTIAAELYRFEPVLRRAVTELVRLVEPEYLVTDGEPKEFFVAFFNMGSQLRVRDLRMGKVGALVSFSGTVTRTSEVRPELLWGRFTCGECGAVSAPVEQQFKYTEPAKCLRADCNNRTSWKLEPSKSRFADWQRVRVQENADEIPPGSMPRSVDVVLRHGAVEKAKAGDKAYFTGTLIVIPDIAQLMKAGTVPTAMARSQTAAGVGGRTAGEGLTGMKALGVRDLTYRVAFLAQSVAKGTPTLLHSNSGGAGDEDNPDADVVSQFTKAQRDEFLRMGSSRNIYGDLVASLAPMIHGHADIKKGILLMLLGGVHKRSAEGVRLRGDLNVCIVGDPSTAKSQFLKYVTKFWPRTVYTSGKSASAAGLTASIAKDPDTGEFTIEAGALMLADNGICCIDEFDKMDAADQVAIHEAMEQQTISITKAGIQATLNARTSVLAAANPIHGRYDPTRTLRQNINISAPIMSRFDLFFVVLDQLDPDRDAAIAEHIVRVHQRKAAVVTSVPYSMETLLNYIRFARTKEPVLTGRAKQSIVRLYRKLREADAFSASSSAYRVTVRQLESMIRLSEAVARLHLHDVVLEKDVQEAYSLIRGSMRRVDHGDVGLDAGDFGDVDVDAAIGLGGDDDGHDDGHDDGYGGGGPGGDGHDDGYDGFGGYGGDDAGGPSDAGDAFGAGAGAGAAGGAGACTGSAPGSAARSAARAPGSSRRRPATAAELAAAGSSGSAVRGSPARSAAAAAASAPGSAVRSGTRADAGGSSGRGGTSADGGVEGTDGAAAGGAGLGPSTAARIAGDVSGPVARHVLVRERSGATTAGAGAGAGAADAASSVGAGAASGGAAGGAEGKKPAASVMMSFEKYQHIRFALSVRLRKKEEEDAEAEAAGASSGSSADSAAGAGAGAGAGAMPADGITDGGADGGAAAARRAALRGALRIRDLIAFYLEEHGHGIATEEEVRVEVRLLRKVISRFIEHDRIFVYAQPAQEADAGVRPDDRWVRLDESFIVEGYDV